MTTGGSAFVDTNVLLRATLVTMLLHREASALLDTQRERGATLWISRQVIREYLVATMLAHGIPTLLTQNVDDMPRFAGKIAIVPLRAAST